MACPDGTERTGKVHYSRWKRAPLPAKVPADPDFSHTVVSIRDSFFGYEAAPETEPPTVSWYINFADHDLFKYYGGTQCALPHPSLSLLLIILIHLPSVSLRDY